jgi:transposase
VGARLLADIAVSKYVDAISLYRQEQMFARIGIELSRKANAKTNEGHFAVQQAGMSS